MSLDRSKGSFKPNHPRSVGLIRRAQQNQGQDSHVLPLTQEHNAPSGRRGSCVLVCVWLRACVRVCKQTSTPSEASSTSAPADGAVRVGVWGHTDASLPLT